MKWKLSAGTASIGGVLLNNLKVQFQASTVYSVGGLICQSQAHLKEVFYRFKAHVLDTTNPSSETTIS